MNSDKETVETIEPLARNDLCTGCGTCVAMCPKEAIEMRIDERKGIYVPKINEEKCNSCGLCHRVCPGHSVDFKALNLDIFGNEPEDVLIGNYRDCYLGHATDDNLRHNAASGGVVTALLLFALEKGLIDGALVTKMSEENPLEPEPFIARTKEEIISACKSKYCPVPANIALREILKEEGRFAVVGLPCHLHGVRKVESVNKKLKEKIVLHVGIFCSHTDTFWQTEFLLKKLGLKKEDVAKIDYRGEGWPGMMSVLLKNGRKVSVPFSEAGSLHGLWLHALLRCAFCCDLTAELADISCGDAWLPEVLTNEKMGKSIVIPRTKIGEALCLEAVQNGYIEIKKTTSYKVKQCGDMMQTKKRDIKARFFIQRLFNKAIPTYNTTLMRPGAANYLRGVLVYLNAGISSKRYLRRFIGSLSRIELGLESCLRRVR
jgi:coenzyme F420 hydrogenase subunit beta